MKGLRMEVMKVLIKVFIIDFVQYVINLLVDIWAKPKSPCCMEPIASTLTGEPNPNIGTKIEAQLAIYKDSERLHINGDLFEWWRISGPRFPELNKIAQLLHSIPSTSVSSERLFSKAGLIYSNNLRNRYFKFFKIDIFYVRLTGKNVRQLLIVKANMDRFNLGPMNDIDVDIFQHQYHC
uniref:Dimer_Tnp_hAT domain-containing protein n=1 Tax=Meloidogyne hapla TaxID=6305 RepID=A0A1I8BGZ8_MELHA